MPKSKNTLDSLVKSLDIKPPEPQFTCEYCKKGFQKEQTLFVHTCRGKHRFKNRTTPAVRIGFEAYQQFYKDAQPSSKPRTYDDFDKSPYYNAFIKLGQYIVDIGAASPKAFMTWVLKSGIKIDYWATDKTYGKFLDQYVAAESMTAAIDRSTRFILKWAERTEQEWVRFFELAHPNLICDAIESGRLSPWFVYSCDSGVNFLDSLDEEQIKKVWKRIDPDIWKLCLNTNEHKHAQETLKEFGW